MSDIENQIAEMQGCIEGMLQICAFTVANSPQSANLISRLKNGIEQERQGETSPIRQSYAAGVNKTFRALARAVELMRAARAEQQGPAH
ncbi:MAG: hypothetical protein LBE78_13320 [Burkholderiaceae bacterium]|jgi:hypothetical protein|nr:hypothetical protein [Burkholderiaceae bacterium]